MYRNGLLTLYHINIYKWQLPLYILQVAGLTDRLLFNKWNKYKSNVRAGFYPCKFRDTMLPLSGEVGMYNKNTVIARCHKVCATLDYLNYLLMSVITGSIIFSNCHSFLTVLGWLKYCHCCEMLLNYALTFTLKNQFLWILVSLSIWL